MLAFITVGSTHFNSLIAAILTENVLSTFRRKGYIHLVVQCGNSAFEFAECLRTCETHVLMKSGVNIEIWRFKPTLEEEYAKADLVIAHAGACMSSGNSIGLPRILYRCRDDPRCVEEGKNDDSCAQSDTIG